MIQTRCQTAFVLLECSVAFMRWHVDEEVEGQFVLLHILAVSPKKRKLISLMSCDQRLNLIVEF